MTTPIKGAIIVSDGLGKVTYIDPPINDNEVFVFDSTEQKGGKFINIKNILPNSFMKSTATDQSSTNTTSYSVIMSLTVPGELMNNIQNIKVLSKKDGSVTSYDVRIYDVTNNLVIAENNFTNSNYSINNIGTLNNLPTNEAVLEIQAKRNGGNGNKKNVYVVECTIEYKNV